MKETKKSKGFQVSLVFHNAPSKQQRRKVAFTTRQ